ncbi:methyl-accepting chemotaxis protein [Sporosarcina sp. Sa2YVA2]|uniref:Methyl-accepting chemotaxis protein n=1 Tax=Sporosarcina quadrami TaxID=2762234 RepID=A0ABR8UCU1_9BACL|nr:methyl-accepting chemotaxis protein [Sporosarcina quadrami]MBD7985831.1 methyl-accepting chemotaxis protein [Sporosarcina quadrami]
MIRFKSIRIKMMFGFSIVLMLLVVLALLTLTVLKNGNTSIDSILEKELPLLIADEQLVASMYDGMGAARGYVLTGNPFYKELFENGKQKMLTNQEFVATFNSDVEFQQLIEETAAWHNFIEEEVFTEYDKGDVESARNNVIEADNNVGPLVGKYEQLASDREDHIIQLEKDLLGDGQRTIIIVFTLSVVGILLSIIISIVTPNSITKPLRVVMKRMKLVAEGDLSHEPLLTKSNDEIGQLITSTNEMTVNTHNLLNQIQSLSTSVTLQSNGLLQSADEVKAGTEQIAITMEDLARGTESQASNISLLSSTMENFVVKIMDASSNGEFIQQSSSAVLDMTNQGSELMKSSTEQMTLIDKIVHDAAIRVKGLDEHAQEVSEIVSVIQGIAGQTNLLALNASIEAARAGEHGKGFAVVADEVRKLAEQSAASVTTITEIVSRIQSESTIVASSLQVGYKEVEQGTLQIQATEETFEGISSAVSEMAKRINIISESLIDISANSQEMSSSIEEIAAISEESAAGVEETSASAEEASSAMEELANSSGDLSKLAEDLNQLVLKFKL